MRTIADYTNPFTAISDFEAEICKFTGAPYAIVTDCCTNALEISFRLDKVTSCTLTPWTYLSVPMLLHKLGINYQYRDESPRQWIGEYNFGGTRIWDSARLFAENMYQPGQVQCVSFGITKPMDIGRGGCILTDDADFAHKANLMRFDGRDIFKYSPWVEQRVFSLGLHCFLRPESCVDGLNLLEHKQFNTQTDRNYNYPDCRTIIISD